MTSPPYAHTLIRFIDFSLSLSLSSLQIEILEHEFNAALNVERVNFPTMDGASRSGVEARAAYAASLEEQRLDALSAVARTLRRERLAAERS